MKKFFRRVYYTILKKLPAKLVVNIENLFTYKRLFNKNKAEYFGEKVQWLKLYGNLEKYNDYVDKYLVRNYIKEKIGEEYLIPLIAVYNKPEEIDYSKLPEQFVLKENHGSGYNIIVDNKETLDIDKTNNKLNRWLKEDYYKIKKEYQYRNVKKKIVCEKYLTDKNNELLDYKFFCFDGVPEFVQVDFGRFTEHTTNYYDMKWNLLDIEKSDTKNYKKDVNAPENFETMVEIARKLCKEFQFVRVDLYNVDGKIYFGELTFTPASGRHSFKPLEKDKEIADKIMLQA